MKIEGFYAAMGLPPGATLDEIRRAYRRLALHFHPDHNHGDASAKQRFIAVTRAYRVLLDYCQSEEERRPDHCPNCGAIVRLYPDTDGRNLCANCLLSRTRRKLLPHPIVRLVRFYGVMGLWLASLVMTVHGAIAMVPAWLIAAFVFAIAGLVWLAIATIWISLPYDPRMPVSSR